MCIKYALRMSYTSVIIGGGIAGQLTAIALHKAGVGSVVYEAYDRTAEHAGAFLTLAVNALDALQAVGIDVRGIGFETPRMTMTSGSGRRIGELTYGEPLADGSVSRTVTRADLYNLLRAEVVRRGIRIEYGKRLVDATGAEDGVRAEFADGTMAEGDLLIGADGLRSRTREVIDPAAPGTRYAGLVNTTGYARGVSTGCEPGVMHAIFGKRCFFVHITDPDGTVWWAANPAVPAERSPAETSSVTSEQRRTRLWQLFRNDRGPATSIIEATEEILPDWNTYDVPTVPTWHRDGMIVIGDAAHATAPSIGQGAAMAIEDGVVLAKCLRDCAEIPVAFTAYETLRRERVERVVDQGNRTGGWKALPPLARIPRDAIMHLAMRRMARTGTDPSRWIYDHHIDWTAPVPESFPTGTRRAEPPKSTNSR